MKDKKVLIVDFDEDSLISLSNLVYEEGFTAVTASDGLAGYEKFKAGDFDLVVIEPMLPKLHGFELCKRISQDPDKKAPIIVVTGIYREPSCKMEALQVYGASAFFTKPWDKDELHSKMLQLLCEGKETPANKEAKPAEPQKTHIPEDWGIVKTPPPAKAPKTSRGLDEIEQRLKQALSESTIPARKKEVVKGKKESPVAVDREVEAMLKGAIGGLGVEEKKKPSEPAPKPMSRSFEALASRLEATAKPSFSAKPAASPRPLATAKPAPSPQPDLQTEKRERIPIAQEIKDRMPTPEKAGNNIPRAVSRAQLDSGKAAFSIDQTLIEIDKIPFDLGKGPEEPERPAPAKETAPPDKKKAFFDEYAEPARKKPAPLIYGVAAAVLIVAAGAGFFALKSKKPGGRNDQAINTLSTVLPAEFSLRQNEIPASQLTPTGTTREEDQKPVSRPEEQPPDIAEQIQPAVSEEVPVVQLQEQPLTSSDTAAKQDPSQTALPPAVEPEAQKSDPGSTPPASSTTTEQTATAQKAKPGDLVALAQVDLAPVLIKKVGPRYPTRALNLGVEGTVTLNALISETGDVVRTEILKGIRGGYDFESAAENAIRQWKFKPAEKDGVPVKVWKSIPINFKLSEMPKE